MHKRDTILAYIEKYKDIAIAEMKRTVYLLPSRLAQVFHEDDCRNKCPGDQIQHHFGIKCKPEVEGEV